MVPKKTQSYIEDMRLDEIVGVHNDACRKALMPEQVDFSAKTLARIEDRTLPATFPYDVIEHLRSDAALSVPTARNGWGTYWKNGERFFWTIRYHDNCGVEVRDVDLIRSKPEKWYRTFTIESESELIE